MWCSMLAMKAITGRKPGRLKCEDESHGDMAISLPQAPLSGFECGGKGSKHDWQALRVVKVLLRRESSREK